VVSPRSDAPLQALVIGTPHPNEPIGGRTICTLLDMLLRCDPRISGMAMRWHFIPSIEPDGLALNEAWLAHPPDLKAYFSNFYRPAFRHQAEYSFPLHAGSYRFDEPTPEAQAWMLAIDSIRPDLMVSLHNADHGGAFCVLSRDDPELVETLGKLPQRQGVGLDTMGDPGAEMLPLGPGVFLAPDFAELVGAAPGVWTAGQSSFGYTARHGTLGLIPEVPRWQERTVEGQLPLDRVGQGLVALYAETASLADEAAGLGGDGLAMQDQLWHDAIAEGAKLLRRLSAMHAALPATLMPATAVLSMHRIARTLPLRTLGMLARWGAGSDVQESAAAKARADLSRRATQLMSHQFADPSLIAGMEPVPIHAAVAVQVGATLAAAQAVVTAA